ncbi:MAG: hypothetical protein ACJAW1_003097 [Glaciecola sp.]|jgi:hypothetical protein
MPSRLKCLTAQKGEAIAKTTMMTVPLIRPLIAGSIKCRAKALFFH